MKRIFILFTVILIGVGAFAQVPQKMSYQAIIRNNNKVLVTNQKITMVISILQGLTPVYVELQTATTNENGLATIQIGTGVALSGVFSKIDWGNGEHYIKTETDPTGGTNYTVVGTSQLLSVPYALYSTTSGSTSGGGSGVTLDDTSISTTKTWSSFKIDAEIALRGNNTGKKMSGDATMDTSGLLTISNSAVTSSKIMDGSVGNSDLDKSNIPLSGFGVPTAPISMDGLKITSLATPTNNNDAVNKKYVDDAIAAGGASSGAILSLDAAQNLSIKGGNAVSLADLYQSLSLAGTVLSISGPRDSHVDLAGILAGIGGSGSGSGVVIHDATLTGSGISASPLSISNQGITPLKLAGISTNGGAGQVLTSDGNGSFVWANAASGGGSGSGLTAITPYGGITSSIAGTTASIGINDGALLLAKLAPIASGTILGNTTAGYAYPTAIPATSLKSMLSLTKSDVGLGNVQNVDQTNADNLITGTVPTGRFGNATVPVSAIIGNGSATSFLRGDGTWGPATGGAGGGVSSVAVATANGFAGTSDGNTTNPTITLTTPLTGLLKGNGTAMVAAVGGTDYLRPTDVAPTATNIAGGTPGELLYQSAAGATTTLPKGSAGQVLTMNAGGTLPIWAAPAAGGLTSVAVTNNNGITASVLNALPTSTITLGLGAITPTSVSTGAVTATGLKITTGASNGYVLKSDAAGNATWQAASSSYKGMWDASTNTPAIANGTGAIGDYYIVSVGGTALTPATTFTQGGQAVYNGSVWQSVSASVVETDPIVKAINGIVYSNGTTISALTLGTNLTLTGSTLNATGGATDITYTASPTQGMVNSSTGADAAIPAATAVNAGLLLPVDFSKVSKISSYTAADVNKVLTVDGTGAATWVAPSGGATDITYTASATQGMVNSSTGADAAIPAATAVNAGLLLPVDFSKVSKISSYTAADVNKVLTVDGTGAATWVAPSGGATDITYTASATQGMVNSSTGADAAIPAATATNAGLLLPADFSKVSKIASFAAADASKVLTVNASGLAIWSTPAVTDLTYTASATQGMVNSSTGADAAIPAATAVNAGLLLPGDFSKLSNIASYTAADANKVLTVNAAGVATWQTPSGGSGTVTPGIQPAAPVYGTPPRSINTPSPIVWGPNDTNVILVAGFTGTINFPSASANPGRIVGVNNRSGGSKLLLNTTGGDTGVYTDEQWTQLTGSSGLVSVISDGVSWRLYAGRP